MNQDEFRMPDTEQQSGKATSQLDLYNEAVQSTVDDSTLSGNNLGLGNYSSAEYWQQIEAFQHGLYADRAFSRKIEQRAIHEAKREIALEGYAFYDTKKDDVETIDGWNDLDEDERKAAWEDRFGDGEPLTRRRWVRGVGDEIWADLDKEQRGEALRDCTGYEGNWKPPQWRMMLARHEGSRSKGAHLLDNVFGRVSEVKDETAEMARQRLDR